MPPKFTPNQPQAGRYWPGKPLQEDHESSSSDEEYEDDEEEQQEQVKPPKAVPDSQYTSKLVTTMKSTSISEAGPYVAPEEESSEDESEDEDENAGSLQPGQRSSKVRQAHRRAIGDFVATDGVNLEESEDEEEEQQEQVKPPKAVPDSQYTSKLVTTMKSTSISEAGPYVAPEEESSEDESEDEDENAGSLQPGQRSSKARQAHRRAIGDFVATDGVNLEESEDEEESEEEESEEESEDEQPLRKPPMLRPTFVPR